MKRWGNEAAGSDRYVAGERVREGAVRNITLEPDHRRFGHQLRKKGKPTFRVSALF